MNIDISISDNGGKPKIETKTPSTPNQQEDDALPVPSNGNTPGREGSQPPIPTNVRAAIDAHRSGKPFKAVFLHPQLADEIQGTYGPHGLAFSHEEAEHGPMGHMMGEEPTNA